MAAWSGGEEEPVEGAPQEVRALKTETSLGLLAPPASHHSIFAIVSSCRVSRQRAATLSPVLDDTGKCKTQVPLSPPVDQVRRWQDRPRGCLCTHDVNHVRTHARCKPILPVHRLVRNVFLPSLFPENLFDARIIRQFNHLAAVIANECQSIEKPGAK